MGHSSTRAALIYLHSSGERLRTLADAVGDAARAALQKTQQPVPLENRIRLVTCGSSGYQAARAYSLIRPPRTGFRRIPSLSTSVIVARGAPGSSSGRRWAMP